MSDLISSSELLKNLKELGWLQDTPLDDIIKNQPTAYDVEKLEDLALGYAINGRQFQADGWESHACDEYRKRDAIHKAIEIVKRGGVE